MKIAFTWDDGALDDLRLIELHEKYNVPGMFFVPTRNCEGRTVLSPSMIQNAKSDLISFGGHTANHIYLTSILAEKIENEVISNQQYLEDIIGEKITHFCLPGGKYTPDMLPVLYKHFETVRTADTMCFKGGSRLCKPTIHWYPRGKKSLIANAFRHKSFEELAYLLAHLPNDYFEVLSSLIFNEKSEDKQIVVWGHSWEIEELNLWEELEAFFSAICSWDDGICVQYEDLFSE